MYRITVNLPNLAHGELVEVDGVGFFKNGESTDLPEDFNEQAFLAHHAPNNIMQDDATREATWGEDAPDLTLLNAFDLHPGVSIEEYDAVSEESGFAVGGVVSTKDPKDDNPPVMGVDLLLDSVSTEGEPSQPELSNGESEDSPYKDLTLEQLKDEVKKRNEEPDRENKLSTSGTKVELVERLKEDDS